MIIAANKEVSPLDESHISRFEVLLLSNLALYRASASVLIKCWLAGFLFWLLRAFTN